ncbi:MAG TPA: hypothetical protein VLN46_04585 [Gillisia sp.]|nr:hypothetical protein [Gillisia sp.]
MKKTYKIISGLFLFSILFTSCTSEEETNEISALEQELSLENKGTLTVESTTYIFKANGETTKFVKNERAFDFSFSGELNYSAANSEAKHEGDDLVITNPDTDEFIRLHDFIELKNNRLQFDVELSNGKFFQSVVYNSPSQLVKDINKCHDGPCRVVNEHAIKSILEMSQADATGSCKETVAACVKAGGKPSVVITRGQGWFTAPQSCVVECK